MRIKSEREKELQRQRRSDRRLMAIELLGGKCTQCGSVDKLEFDHIKKDRDGLTGLVSQLFSCSVDKLLNELEKCQLLCKPCHVEKSTKERGFIKSTHGMLSMYVNKKCRCEDCRSALAHYMRQYKKQGLSS